MNGQGAAVSADLAFTTTELPTVEVLVHAQEDTATAAEMMPVVLRSSLTDVQGNVDRFYCAAVRLTRRRCSTSIICASRLSRSGRSSFTDTIHTAQRLYSNFVELGIDPNTYFSNSVISINMSGAFAKVAKNLVQQAQATSATPTDPM